MIRATLLRRASAVVTIVSISFLLSGCDDGAPTGPSLPSIWGNADLSRYVAIGNSLTMGVVDGALVEEGSECSYPALLARQARIENFEVPRFADPGVVAFPPNEVGVLDAGRMRLVSLNPPSSNGPLPPANRSTRTSIAPTTTSGCPTPSSPRRWLPRAAPPR